MMRPTRGRCPCLSVRGHRQACGSRSLRRCNERCVSTLGANRNHAQPCSTVIQGTPSGRGEARGSEGGNTCRVDHDPCGETCGDDGFWGTSWPPTSVIGKEAPCFCCLWPEQRLVVRSSGPRPAPTARYATSGSQNTSLSVGRSSRIRKTGLRRIWVNKGEDVDGDTILPNDLPALPRRRGVERPTAWSLHTRRLSRDGEGTPPAARRFFPWL
jgi:hypothetical protein